MTREVTLAEAVEACVADYMRSRAVHDDAAKDGRYKAHIEKTTFQFTGHDSRRIAAALNFYYELLSLDAEAPDNLKTHVHLLASQFFQAGENFDVHEFRLDVNQFHMMAKAFEVWLLDDAHKYLPTRERMKLLDDFIRRGRPLP